MSYSKIKIVLLIVYLASVSGCSLFITEPPTVPYSKTELLPLYNLGYWSLGGRLSITGQKDSLTANIDWKHQSYHERVKLSGPLGQGATVIELSQGIVTIDKGDGKTERSNQPEAFIAQKLRMPVPIQSLRYWAIGLPEPNQDFIETVDGFKQAGWLIEYKAMQSVKTYTLPYKINVSNEQVKLKLIIDEWGL